MPFFIIWQRYEKKSIQNVKYSVFDAFDGTSFWPESSGYELEDLYQLGCMGFIKCIQKFDTNLEYKLSTYAVPLITGEIKRFLRDDGMIKVSRSLKENAFRIKMAEEQLQQEQLHRE